MNGEFVVVGRIGDFPLGKLKKVQVAGEDVVVAKIDEKIYAIAGKCTHQGGPLVDGELDRTILVCPLHGGEFDIRTGKVVSPPPMKDAATYDVQIQGSEVLIRKK